MTKACLLVQEFWLEGQTSGWIQIQSPKEALLEDRGQPVQSLCPLSASLHLMGIFQKEAYTVVWSPEFCDCCPGEQLYEAWLW